MNHTSLQNLALQIFEAFIQIFWMWIFPWIKLSWHSCPCETNLNDLIDSRGYLRLIRKDSVTCMVYNMHGLVVYVKEGLLFARDLSLENSADSYLFSTSFTSLSVLSFPSINHPLCLYVFDDISSDIDEVLSINPSANVFVFQGFWWFQVE